jgi:hypothetical protein
MSESEDLQAQKDKVEAEMGRAYSQGKMQLVEILGWELEEINSRLENLEQAALEDMAPDYTFFNKQKDQRDRQERERGN